MGTNYYGMVIPTEDDKKEIVRLVNEDKYNVALLLFPQRIHLGKSSAGWEFLFNHNNWEFYSKNIGTIRAFISRIEIVDEYERPVTVSDFWKLVESKKGGLRHELYMEQWNDLHPDIQKPHYQNDKLDFTVDGLRFSTSTEFS